MKGNGLFQAGIKSLFNCNDIFFVNCLLALFSGFFCQFQRIKQDGGVIPIWTPFLVWHILSPIETFATVEAMSESRIFEDLPIIICSNFGWIPVLLIASLWARA